MNYCEYSVVLACMHRLKSFANSRSNRTRSKIYGWQWQPTMRWKAVSGSPLFKRGWVPWLLWPLGVWQQLPSLQLHPQDTDIFNFPFFWVPTFEIWATKWNTKLSNYRHCEEWPRSYQWGQGIQTKPSFVIFPQTVLGKQWSPAYTVTQTFKWLLLVHGGL